MDKKTLEDFDFNNKRVLVRCDFNVPMDDEGKITDDIRIKSSLPTINYLIEKGAKVILMSHLGRPKGQANPKYSLGPVKNRLSQLLNKDILFLKDDLVYSEEVKEKVLKMEAGQVALLENTRFRKEEEKNIDEFSKDLASLGEVFVNDAFGTSHRAHSSNVGVSTYLPSAVGFLVEKEIEFFSKALENPDRPFVAILGGAKVSDKIGVIENLLNKVDSILIGGAMSFTFLKAQGYETGRSLVEEDKVDLAKSLLELAKEKGVKIDLPLDIVVAKEFKNDTEYKTVEIDKIPEDMMGLDIGQATVDKYSTIIKAGKTIVWNGPMGVFEMDNFNKGTFAIGKAMSQSKGITIVGGGDSASAIEKAGYDKLISHISTGGGASLEYLEGKELPGIGAISDRGGNN